MLDLPETTTKYQQRLTIEDPIELRFARVENKWAWSTSGKCNRDNLVFAEALRSALRENPDIMPVWRDARPGKHPPGADSR